MYLMALNFVGVSYIHLQQYINKLFDYCANIILYYIIMKIHVKIRRKYYIFTGMKTASYPHLRLIMGLVYMFFCLGHEQIYYLVTHTVM